MIGDKDKFDPVAFAVIKARIDGTIQEMVQTILRTARTPILYAVKDFTCSLLSRRFGIECISESVTNHIECQDCYHYSRA